jgi:hypothetical protein
LAPVCANEIPSVKSQDLFLRAQLAGVGMDDDVAGLRSAIEALRTTDGQPPGFRVILDHSEGRAILASDRRAGTTLLKRAITGAKAAPDDVDAQKAAGWSYALLAIDAARHRDGAATLGVLAEEIGVEAPTSCVIGLAADFDVVGVARGRDGKDVVRVQRRTSAAIPLPDGLADAVVGCDVVDVLARAPFHGTPHLLPSGIAWRYRSARARPLAPAGTKHVVIADVEPPSSLGLPRLASWSRTGDVLAGPAATPARVLAAINDANEVVVHAHGLVDGLDASSLVLSPDASGTYALTTRDVRAAQFRTSPLVVLAACHASQGAPILHAPWSLPAAFVFAGARAVVASTSPIPDADAPAFFDDFDRRVAAGSDAAIALRDSRKAWASRGGAGWVEDRIVFE